MINYTQTQIVRKVPRLSQLAVFAKNCTIKLVGQCSALLSLSTTRSPAMISLATAHIVRTKLIDRIRYELARDQELRKMSFQHNNKSERNERII